MKVPAGIYDAAVCRVEHRKYPNGGYGIRVFYLTYLFGTWTKAEFGETFHLNHPTQKAVEISMGRLSALLLAVGEPAFEGNVGDVKDLTEFLQKKMVRVHVEQAHIDMRVLLHEQHDPDVSYHQRRLSSRERELLEKRVACLGTETTENFVDRGGKINRLSYKQPSHTSNTSRFKYSDLGKTPEQQEQTNEIRKLHRSFANQGRSLADVTPAVVEKFYSDDSDEDSVQ